MITTTEQPKYRRLADMLRSQIKLGELKVGDRLPSFAEMYRDHGATKTTLRRVYELLEKENLIERRGGSGVYVANPLQTQKTGKLGLLFRVAGSFSHPYLMDLLAGVQDEGARHGLEIVLLEQETQTIKPGKMDALLLFCHETEALLMDLPPNLPHVLLVQHSPDFTCITPDDFEGAKMATQHLLDLGHQRIACMPATDHDSVSRQRSAGYQAALQEAGVPVRSNFVRFLRHRRTQKFREICEEAMACWLKEDWQEMGCTAIVAHNDDAAIGIMKALHAAGLRVPDEVSVTGFDGTEISNLCTPRLTTVEVPLAEIGARAVKVLLERMRDGVSRTEKIVLPVRLKIGESTAQIKLKE